MELPTKSISTWSKEYKYDIQELGGPEPTSKAENPKDNISKELGELYIYEGHRQGGLTCNSTIQKFKTKTQSGSWGVPLSN